MEAPGACPYRGEAADVYYEWTLDWLKEAKRVLKPNGSFYLVMGWSNLRHVLNAVSKVGFHKINHLIWSHSFGRFNPSKFCSSHFDILFLKKDAKAKHKFNHRFPIGERDEGGLSNLNKDIQDVMYIKKDYLRAQMKSPFKLPDELIWKLIEISSDKGDMVGDFFLGNGTTCLVARSLGRHSVGFEINPLCLSAYSKQAS